MDLNLPTLIAHRGAPRLALENTIAALIAAKKAGARWVEFDVMLTQDDVPIVFHDADLFRIAQNNQVINNSTYAAIHHIKPEIPTLQEYLQKAAELEMGINIEMKATQGREAKLAKIVLQQLEKNWHTKLPIPLLSSFSKANLIALKTVQCPYPLGLNTSKWQVDFINTAVELDCYSIHMHKNKITTQRVKANTEHGLQTLAYTVNDKQEAERLLQQGVVAVFSDVPDLLV